MKEELAKQSVLRSSLLHTMHERREKAAAVKAQVGVRSERFFARSSQQIRHNRLLFDQSNVSGRKLKERQTLRPQTQLSRRQSHTLTPNTGHTSAGFPRAVAERA